VTIAELHPAGKLRQDAGRWRGLMTRREVRVASGGRLAREVHHRLEEDANTPTEMAAACGLAAASDVGAGPQAADQFRELTAGMRPPERR